MDSPAPNQEPPDEDKLDFDLLKRQLTSSRLFANSDRSSQSSSSTNTTSGGSTSPAESEIWPLQLNTVTLDHYILGDTIGNGSYAEVRECVHTGTLERCAVKIVNKRHLNRQNPIALLNQLQEIRLLRRFQHANIISMKECIRKRQKIYIFLEHCSFVLNDLLNEQPNKRLCVSLCRNLFKQLIAGLSYLHSIGIIHRDIKPQNLLINNCGTLKIIDFGVSQLLSMWTRDDRCTNYEGSPLFQAPEVVTGQAEYAGFKVDIWSAGVTLYLMLFGEYPFDDEALLGLYDKILSQELSFPLQKVRLDQEAVVVDLLGAMLEKSGDRRASLRYVQLHPWLNWALPNNDSSCRDGLDHTELLACAVQHDTNKGDIYRSMSVLPYLHNHHFPNLPVMKVKHLPSLLSNSTTTSQASSPSNLSPVFSPANLDQTSTGNSDANSTNAPSLSATDGSLAPDAAATAATLSNDPHQMIDDRPIEWGTKRQYKLLKVPLIRANRVRRRGGRKRRWNNQKEAQ